jgi:hypothetical protein
MIEIPADVRVLLEAPNYRMAMLQGACRRGAAGRIVPSGMHRPRSGAARSIELAQPLDRSADVGQIALDRRLGGRLGQVIR